MLHKSAKQLTLGRASTTRWRMEYSQSSSHACVQLDLISDINSFFFNFSHFFRFFFIFSIHCFQNIFNGMNFKNSRYLSSSQIANLRLFESQMPYCLFKNHDEKNRKIQNDENFCTKIQRNLFFLKGGQIEFSHRPKTLPIQSWLEIHCYFVRSYVQWPVLQ